MNHILKVLRDIQQGLCAYRGDRCDCKFGGQNIGKLTETGNGCPEMRTAIWALEESQVLIEKARQLASVADDWHLPVVEIDGEMVSTISLMKEFEGYLERYG